VAKVVFSIQQHRIEHHFRHNGTPIFSASAFIFLTFTANGPRLSFHNISVPSIALDIQHFLKPFTITSGEMHCHAMMIYWQRRIAVTSRFFQLVWKHGCLPRVTNYTHALGSLWMVCLPQHLTLAVVGSSPRYNYKVCDHGITTNWEFLSVVLNVS
jgi:hypothetical protein